MGARRAARSDGGQGREEVGTERGGSRSCRRSNEDAAAVNDILSTRERAVEVAAEQLGRDQ